jgi:pimeloyl-ACP methyl ester carboxylesterase
MPTDDITKAQILSLPDGRCLEMFAAPTEGVPLVLCHGTPGCGMLAGDWVAAAAAHGLRLVGYSRPGYGTSTRRPGRTVADVTDDVHAVAAALGTDRLFVLGHSGGGAHALACAALLSGLVEAAAVVAGAAPRDAQGLDWFAGQHPENVEEFEAAQAGGDALASLLHAWREEILAPPAGTGAEPESADTSGAFDAFLSEPDRAASTSEGRAFAHLRQRHGLAPGIWGWYDDDLTETRHWGFDVRAIATPVSVWHGVQDGFVPLAHGRWLADTIPGARWHPLPDEGHFSLFQGPRFGELLAELRDLA